MMNIGHFNLFVKTIFLLLNLKALKLFWLSIIPNLIGVDKVEFFFFLDIRKGRISLMNTLLLKIIFLNLLGNVAQENNTFLFGIIGQAGLQLLCSIS
ncbi:MAG: hypothetical protein A2080_03055 [Ignavibacteria bacterium GWC2_36_12]|nr:MAG: hypothetical protein A2080_03055 [Ignavibacteria bacterium GWC2_36_12]